jgi:amidohydrolase
MNSAAIRRKAEDLKSFIIERRRDIHRQPELGYREIKTRSKIIHELESMGITDHERMAVTGIVATIKKGEGKTVALRADIDALPIKEQTGSDYASENEGIMHACGHDSHTAMLLGASKILVESDFKGTIKLLFQPSEENNYDDPMGWSGGKRMVEEGALDGVDAAFAIHQIPTMPSGCFAILDGPVLAAASFFEIKVFGKASHAGASPEKGVDAVLIAAAIVQNLQSIVSRNLPASEAGVISIGSIHGGTAPNIIADKVIMNGTIRALKDDIYTEILNRTMAIATQTASVYGGRAEFIVKHSVPVTSNDPLLAKLARQTAEEFTGKSKLLDIKPLMAGEDFSFISQKLPSCFCLLGTRVPQGEAFTLHHPKMQLNEEVLPLGTSFLTGCALSFLEN